MKTNLFSTIVIIAAIQLAGCGGGANAAGASDPAAAAQQIPSLPASAAAPAPLQTLPPLPPATIQRFGADLGGNGIPDRLDEFIAKRNFPPATKAAYEFDVHLTVELADKVIRGVALTDAERQKAFASSHCLLLTAKADGVTNLPSPDDEFMKDKASFSAMYALMGALDGTISLFVPNKEKMCAAAGL